MSDADERGQDASLRAFEASSDRIIAKTALQYVDYVRNHRRVMDSAKWCKLKSERGVDLYTERVEQRVARKERHGGGSITTVRGSNSTRSASSNMASSFQALDTTMVSAFGGGTLYGTLDAAMQGLCADSTEQMQLNAAIQYGGVLDCGVVRTFRTKSNSQPYEFFGVKFVEKFGHIPGVIDQLCWVERLGTLTTAGRRFGFHLLKSVEIEDRSSDQSVRRVNMSVCYLYCQNGLDAVDVFIRGIVELPGSSKSQRRKETISAAGDYILATIHGRECQRMKTIASLIEKSKTERESLNACHCSKTVRGLEKVEMCSGCRESMQQPKLVAVSDADSRRRGSRGACLGKRVQAFPGALTQLFLADITAMSESCRGAKLQSRYGSTRGDGDLPESVTRSYCESNSFRMLMPIRDPRPMSNYRVARRKRENILITMLRRHDHERRNATAATTRHTIGA